LLFLVGRGLTIAKYSSARVIWTAGDERDNLELERVKITLAKKIFDYLQNSVDRTDRFCFNTREGKYLLIGVQGRLSAIT
jgi:hypothetical protein